jgi:CheY-like chemotaxis protein
MEALGQLTGGVAHDFNNMLAVLMMDLEILDELTAGKEELHELVREARDVTRTGADLTQRLLAFSRRQQLHPIDINLNELISETTGLLRRTLGEAIRIDTIGPSDLWSVHADQAQLVNAIVNLAVNARDAMPSGGRLTIETSNVAPGERLAASADPMAGEFVRLSVSDTGVGMTPEVLDRALEPFFTTKETTAGTGLGLSMVYGFIKQSGGHVAIESEAGHGARVHLYLPRATAKDSTASPTLERSASLPRGSETILLVEDHVQLRQRTSRVLAELGYHVIQAENGTQALDRLEDAPAVDLLFTDVVMPGGLYGPELAEQARRSRPRLKLMFASGYAEQATGMTKFLDAGAELLRKPYSKRDLATTIRRVLDASD